MPPKKKGDGRRDKALEDAENAIGELYESSRRLPAGSLGSWTRLAFFAAVQTIAATVTANAAAAEAAPDVPQDGNAGSSGGAPSGSAPSASSWEGGPPETGTDADVFTKVMPSEELSVPAIEEGVAAMEEESPEIPTGVWEEGQPCSHVDSVPVFFLPGTGGKRGDTGGTGETRERSPRGRWGSWLWALAIAAWSRLWALAIAAWSRGS